MIGKTISHYKILEKLGEGGMGVVYKAQDTKLRRTVALKFLPQDLTRDEDAKQRFIHEAQAASALQHNNICAIHEIDETPDGHLFISMDCYEGETLKEKITKGPLQLEEAIEIVIQAARGLDEAHGKGIVHRDIKPANIMVTEKGQVKIMDFGLAKAAGQTQVTKTGTTIGTVAYMSPEQARGERIDHRTDVWSLGVMLYEMVTGQRPFKGDYEQAVIYSILSEVPEPMTALRTGVPQELERITGKAMAKKFGERYQHVDELLVDLQALRKKLESRGRVTAPAVGKPARKTRRIAIAAVAVIAIALILAWPRLFPEQAEPIDSIAVLPLENLSGDPSQEYFADGIHEELIKTLSKMSAISVTSRTSVMQYKDTKKPLPEIADELGGVDAIVEGSVLHAGDSVRITVQLVEAATDRHLWADSYDRELRNILTLHSEVARAIAHEIQVTLTPQEQNRLASVRPVDPEAHDLYLKGRYHQYKSTKPEIEKAIEYFQQVIEIDPNYAQAYAMLAAAYQYLWLLGYLPMDETKTKVETLIKKALEIDDTIAEAHMALAEKRFSLDWDWLGAENEIQRAIELNPSFVDARVKHAHHLLAMGRFEEAIAEAKRALQLDPVSYSTNSNLAYIYRMSRHYDRAIAQYQQVVELEPNRGGPHFMLAWTYEAMGRYDDAVKAMQESMTHWGDPPEKIAAYVAALDSAYSESGPKGYWMWRLERLNGKYDRYPLQTAALYGQLGDMDQAFAWLEKAYKEHQGIIYLLKVSPSLDPLRDDPRYEDLLRRMNFPENETQQ